MTMEDQTMSERRYKVMSVWQGRFWGTTSTPDEHYSSINPGDTLITSCLRSDMVWSSYSSATGRFLSIPKFYTLACFGTRPPGHKTRFVRPRAAHMCKSDIY